MSDPFRPGPLVVKIEISSRVPNGGITVLSGGITTDRRVIVLNSGFVHELTTEEAVVHAVIPANTLQVVSTCNISPVITR